MLGGHVPFTTENLSEMYSQVEAKKMHETAAWKEFSARNMFEDTYMGSAEFAQFLTKRRDDMLRFMAQVGPAQK